jgi:hypothetical protein
MDQCGGSMSVSTLDPVTLDEAAHNLERAIMDYDRAAEGEGAIITGWVTVAEFIDHEGQPHLAAYAAHGMPFWRIDGLIEAAPSAMLYMEEFEE